MAERGIGHPGGVGDLDCDLGPEDGEGEGGAMGGLEGREGLVVEVEAVAEGLVARGAFLGEGWGGGVEAKISGCGNGGGG